MDIEGGSGKRHVGFQALTMISVGAQLEFPLDLGGIQRAEYLTQGPKNKRLVTGHQPYPGYPSQR